jgi:hypothetical protein
MTPIVYRWTGTTMEPLYRYAEQCADQFEVGATYYLGEVDEGSDASRRHYFACLRAAFDNLPERLAAKYSSVEHMRKRALIRAGYRQEKFVNCESQARALWFAAQIEGDFDVVEVRGKTVYHAVAKSQAAMGKAEFQASKDAVLDLVSKAIGTDVRTLLANAA